MRQLLCFFTILIYPIDAFQGKQLSHQKLEQLFNKTFGQITSTDFVSSDLKKELLASATIDAQMAKIVEKKSSQFTLATEAKYREAATLYMRQFLNHRYNNKQWSFDMIPISIQPRLQMTASFALANGFDALLAHLIKKGVKDDEKRNITRALGKATESYIQISNDWPDRQKKFLFISAIKQWISYWNNNLNETECSIEENKMLALTIGQAGKKERQKIFFWKREKDLFEKVLTILLKAAQRDHEPELCGLLVQYGADPSVIAIPPAYLQYISSHWISFEAEVRAGKYSDNPSLKNNESNRKFRTADVRAAATLHHFFEELHANQASYVSWLPTELIEEIRNFRFGISARVAKSDS